MIKICCENKGLQKTMRKYLEAAKNRSFILPTAVGQATNRGDDGRSRSANCSDDGRWVTQPQR
jgi:hypothetical protein